MIASHIIQVAQNRCYRCEICFNFPTMTHTQLVWNKTISTLKASPSTLDNCCKGLKRRHSMEQDECANIFQNTSQRYCAVNLRPKPSFSKRHGWNIPVFLRSNVTALQNFNQVCKTKPTPLLSACQITLKMRLHHFHHRWHNAFFGKWVAWCLIIKPENTWNSRWHDMDFGEATGNPAIEKNVGAQMAQKLSGKHIRPPKAASGTYRWRNLMSTFESKNKCFP